MRRISSLATLSNIVAGRNNNRKKAEDCMLVVVSDYSRIQQPAVAGE